MMVNVPFFKVESVGNDFVLVHSDDFDGEPVELAKQACRRHFGVGSDGLLLLKRLPDNAIEIRMFNPDGTEDFCGNGIRCSLLHAWRQGWIDEKPTAYHLGRTVSGHLINDVASGDANPLIKFELPAATYEPASVPVKSDREVFDWTASELFGSDIPGPVVTQDSRVSSLSTGSTHTIVWVDRPLEDEEFLKIGAKFEENLRFPERTSIMFTQVIAERELTLRIWERGAEETLGCGTGSTAAAVDYMRRNNLGGDVVVHNPGGSLVVSATHWDRPLLLSGKAEELFSGTFYFQD